jgi:TrmH family RNA methyltransferase
MLDRRRVKTISSRHNPVVRAFRELADAPDPTGRRLLLDGVHLVHDAHAAGTAFELVAVDAARLEAPSAEAHLARTLERDGIELVAVSSSVFTALSPVKSPSGIAAIATRPPASAAGICSAREAFVLVVIDVQDPGNVGSVLRAAEAAGVSGVLVCGTSANPFSWKSLRGSMGSALRLPAVAGLSASEAVTCLKAAGIRLVASVARGGDDPDTVDWRGRVALLLGGEGAGLSDEVLAHADSRVTIPMAPGVESLNIAVAAGVLVYAARRQRA